MCQLPQQQGPIAYDPLEGWYQEREIFPWLVPARHRCTAFKAKEELAGPKWEDVQKITDKHLQVWAQHKLECRKIKVQILIKRPDLLPQTQCKYLAEASLQVIFVAFLDQEVVVEMQCENSGLVWLVRETDRKTWRSNYRLQGFKQKNSYDGSHSSNVPRSNSSHSWRVTVAFGTGFIKCFLCYTLAG